jgi:hypothetical protein
MTRHTFSLAPSGAEAPLAAATAQVLDELQLYGHHLTTTADPRPLPNFALDAAIAACSTLSPSRSSCPREPIFPI